MSIEQIEIRILSLIMNDEKLQEQSVGIIKQTIVYIANKIKEAEQNVATNN